MDETMGGGEGTKACRGKNELSKGVRKMKKYEKNA